MASKGRQDVVARLVSKKLRSRILKSCSSSEEDSPANDGKVEEEYVESFESIEEEAGGCKHGPPTDYPCHLCCLKKWVSARRHDHPALKINCGPPTANLWSDWSPQPQIYGLIGPPKSA